uniref:Xaa-Pro dipeptidyl-peptidase-like domain-containing protein n=1 Tax=Bionectria ochroleuca TaxID=29856 RepID=A0A8H7NGQ4_BIOOC
MAPQTCRRTGPSLRASRGSYDDPVLEEVAAHLVRAGFVVATFNFRGAANSEGRTSWSAKPEREDYTTLVGFLTYYIHYLDHRESRPQNPGSPILLMGGYSYGAMITTQIPPLSSILAQFTSPSIASTPGLLRTRAESLGTQQRELLQMYSGRRSLRVGECSSPRKSHDSRRSFSLDDAEEKLRKGVQDFIAKTRHHHHRPAAPASAIDGKTDPPLSAPDSPAAEAAPAEDATLQSLPDLLRPCAAYLLISPSRGSSRTSPPCRAPPGARLRRASCGTIPLWLFMATTMFLFRLGSCAGGWIACRARRVRGSGARRLAARVTSG